MSLKDTARTVAVLSTLADAIGDQLKSAKKELEAGLREAKAETGTQKIGVSLEDAEGQSRDVGTVSLVQPKAAAAITDSEAFTAWVVENFATEITRRFVTSVKPGFQKKILDQITAAGVTEWADPDTGVIHTVPGVAMQGRAAYTRMTIPDAGKASIAQAWRTGRLAAVVPAVAPPAIESGDDDTAKLRARIAELEERDSWLSALEAAGVDNWEGWDHAVELSNGGDQ
ncbi:hypothetical protein ACPESV_24680 [Streptomyces umbrinus]|uniref:hypothetical protein n=1 Tax=Streptomyces umbrinus TaxID=67370 RepID=UPI003C2BE829